MFKARYYKADGKKGRARALPEAIFDGVVNEGAMHQVVKAYLSNQRQGTAAAKTRSDVRGGSRKPWRQKGTGRARQGTIRAVQWEGGGVAFPPIPHSWRKRVPRQVGQSATRRYFCRFSRTMPESVSRYRRSMFGITPSKRCRRRITSPRSLA